MSRLRVWTKIVLINILIFLCLFAFLEILFRALYPEFANQIHSPTKTLGKNIVFGKLNGVTIRIPYAGYDRKINLKTPMILVLGDSISEGYGCCYEDIYWRKLERLLNITNSHPIQIISLCSYGNNLYNSANDVQAFLSKSDMKLPVKAIIYQFNYNDITPFDRETILKGKHLTGIENTGWFKKIAFLRYQYLNYSVFLRVLQHYAGILKIKRHGTCEARGYDALRWYTFTYGSKPFNKESEKAWLQFEQSLKQIKELSDKINAKFIIVISPLLYDIDKQHIHPYYNFQNIDFNCATINPIERLTAMARKMDIDVINPTAYVRKHFEEIVKEGNFEPFYFTAEDNHFTPNEANYLAEYMLKYFVNHKVY
jgi:hypothetical protein